jgi:hypothetical protein
MFSTCLGLDDHLTATATGPRRLFCHLSVSASGCDGKHPYWHVRIQGTGSKQCRPLCTEARWIGGILLITAYHDLTIFQPDCGSYTKVGVGGIAATGGFDGLLYQLAVFGAEFIHLAFLDDGFKFYFFHRLNIFLQIYELFEIIHYFCTKI